MSERWNKRKVIVDEIEHNNRTINRVQSTFGGLKISVVKKLKEFINYAENKNKKLLKELKDDERE